MKFAAAKFFKIDFMSIPAILRSFGDLRDSGQAGAQRWPRGSEPPAPASTLLGIWQKGRLAFGFSLARRPPRTGYREILSGPKGTLATFLSPANPEQATGLRKNQQGRRPEPKGTGPRDAL